MRRANETRARAVILVVCCVLITPQAVTTAASPRAMEEDAEKDLGVGDEDPGSR